MTCVCLISHVQGKNAYERQVSEEVGRVHFGSLCTLTVIINLYFTYYINSCL